MSKLFSCLYRCALLILLGVIAAYSFLIYERMPMTVGEFAKIKDEHERRDMLANRTPMIKVPGTVDVNVTNASLDVDADVTNSELDVNVQNEVTVSGTVSIEH
jgi:hypothetical protein